MRPRRVRFSWPVKTYSNPHASYEAFQEKLSLVVLCFRAVNLFLCSFDVRLIIKKEDASGCHWATAYYAQCQAQRIAEPHDDYVPSQNFLSCKYQNEFPRKNVDF